MTESIIDLDTVGHFNITEANMSFAMQKPDPRVGRVVANLVERKDNVYTETPIPMVDCYTLFS